MSKRSRVDKPSSSQHREQRLYYRSIRDINLDKKLERVPSFVEFVSIRDSLAAHQGNFYGQWSVNLMRRIQDQFNYSIANIKWLQAILQSSALPLYVPLLRHDITVELASQLEPALIEELLGHILCDVESSNGLTSLQTFSYDHKSSNSDQPGVYRRQISGFSKTEHCAGSESPDSFGALLSRLNSYCEPHCGRTRLPEKDHYNNSTTESHSIQRRGHNPHRRSSLRSSPTRDGRRPSKGSISSNRKNRSPYRNHSSPERRSVSAKNDRTNQRFSDSGSKPAASKHPSKNARPKASQPDDDDVRLLIKRADDAREKAKMLQAQADLTTSTLPHLHRHPQDLNSGILQGARPYPEMMPININIPSVMETPSRHAYAGFGKPLPGVFSQLSMPTTVTSDVPVASSVAPDVRITTKSPPSCGSAVESTVLEPSSSQGISSLTTTKVIPPSTSSESAAPLARPTVTGSSVISVVKTGSPDVGITTKSPPSCGSAVESTVLEPSSSQGISSLTTTKVIPPSTSSESAAPLARPTVTGSSVISVVKTGSPDVGITTTSPSSCGSAVEPTVLDELSPSHITYSLKTTKTTSVSTVSQSPAPSARPTVTRSNLILVVQTGKSTSDGNSQVSSVVNDVEKDVSVKPATSLVSDGLNENTLCSEKTTVSSASSINAQTDNLINIPAKVSQAIAPIPIETTGLDQKPESCKLTSTEDPSFNVTDESEAVSSVPSQDNLQAKNTEETFTFDDNTKIKMTWIGTRLDTMIRFKPNTSPSASPLEKFDYAGFFMECFHRMSQPHRASLQNVGMLANRLLKSKHFKLNEPVCWSLSKIWHSSISVRRRCFNGYGGLANSAILNALGLVFPWKVADLRLFARNQGFLGWKSAQKQYNAVLANKKFDALRSKFWVKLNEIFFLNSTSTTYLQKDTGQLVYEKLKEVVGMVLEDANLSVSTGPVCVEVWTTLKNSDDEQILTGSHFSTGSACLSLISSMFDVSQVMKFLDDLMILLGAGSLKRNPYNQVAVEFYWDLLFARADFLMALCQTCGNMDPEVEAMMKPTRRIQDADVLDYLVADDAFYYNLIRWFLGRKFKTPYQRLQFLKMWRVSQERRSRSTKMMQGLYHLLTGMVGCKSHNQNMISDLILKSFADPKIFIMKVCQSSYACHMVEALMSNQPLDGELQFGFWYYVRKIQNHIAIKPYTALCVEVLPGNEARPPIYENASSITGLVLGQAEYQRRATFIRSMCQGDHKDSKLAKIIQRCLKCLIINPSQFEAVLDVASRDILCVPAIEQLHNIATQEWWHMAFWKHVANDAIKMPDLTCPQSVAQIRLSKMMTSKSSSLPGEIAHLDVVKGSPKDALVSSTPSCQANLTETVAEEKLRQNAVSAKVLKPDSDAKEKPMIAKSVSSKRKQQGTLVGVATDTTSGLGGTPVVKKRKLGSDAKETGPKPVSGMNKQTMVSNVMLKGKPKDLLILTNMDDIEQPLGKSSPGLNKANVNQKLLNILRFMGQQTSKGSAHNLIVSTPGGMNLIRFMVRDDELETVLKVAIACKDDTSPICSSFAKWWKILRSFSKVAIGNEPSDACVNHESISLDSPSCNELQIMSGSKEDFYEIRTICYVLNEVITSVENHFGERTSPKLKEKPEEEYSGVMSEEERSTQELKDVVNLMTKQKVKGPAHMFVVATPGWMRLLRLAIKDEQIGPTMKEALICKDDKSPLVFSFIKGWNRLLGPSKFGEIEPLVTAPSSGGSATKPSPVSESKPADSDDSKVSGDNELNLTARDIPPSNLQEVFDNRLAEILKLVEMHPSGPYCQNIVQTTNWKAVMQEIVRNDHFYSVITDALTIDNCVTVKGINAMNIWHDLSGAVNSGLVLLSSKPCVTAEASSYNSSSNQTNQTKKFNVEDNAIDMPWHGSLEVTLERFTRRHPCSNSFDIAGFFMDCFDRMPTVEDCKTNLSKVIRIVNGFVGRKQFRLPQPTFCAKSKMWKCCISERRKFYGWGRFLNTAVLNALGLACPEKVTDLRYFARDRGLVGWRLARKQYAPFSSAQIKGMLWAELNKTFFLRQSNMAYFQNGCGLVYDNLKKVVGSVFEHNSVAVTSGSVCTDIVVGYKDDQNVEKTLSGTHFSVGSACLSLISSLFSTTELIKFLDDLMLLLGGGTLKHDSSNQVAIDFYWDLLLARVDFVKELAKTNKNLIKPQFNEKYLDEQTDRWTSLVADDAFYYNLIGWLLTGKLEIGNSSHHEQQFRKMWAVAISRQTWFSQLSKVFEGFIKDLDRRMSAINVLHDEIRLIASFKEIFVDPKIFLSKMCQSSYLFQGLRLIISGQVFGNRKNYKSHVLLCVRSAVDSISLSPYATVKPEVILSNSSRAFWYKNADSICGLMCDQVKCEQFADLISWMCEDPNCSDLTKVVWTLQSGMDPEHFEALIQTASRDVLYPLAIERWVKRYSQNDDMGPFAEEKAWLVALWQKLALDALKMPDLRWPNKFDPESIGARHQRVL